MRHPYDHAGTTLLLGVLLTMVLFFLVHLLVG
jgi:hypothetical protein